jgi:hypothetical protein
MMRHQLAGLALAFLLGTGCSSDNDGVSPPAGATVTGVVREGGSNSPVAGATVSLAGASTTSTVNGQFQLQNVPTGVGRSLVVFAPGYATFSQSVEVKAGANTLDVTLMHTGLYEAGNYLMYLPPQITTYRGVFVVMFGGTVDTRPLLRGDLNYYQPFPLSGDVVDYRQRMFDFARNNGFAVVAAAFGTQTRGTVAYANLMNAVNTVGNQSGHAELANAPFVLHGHSATACFAYEFAIAHPNRTIGFIAAKMSCNADPGAAVGVPGYFFFGENDLTVPAHIAAQMRTLVEQNRARGALWAYAVEPGAGHAQVANQELLFDWVAAAVALRLPATGSVLQPISEAAGWLGDHATFAVGSHPCFSSNKATASWLPSAQTARDWQTLVSRGSITTTLTC